MFKRKPDFIVGDTGKNTSSQRKTVMKPTENGNEAGRGCGE
jgi:hypothetical protein